MSRYSVTGLVDAEASRRRVARLRESGMSVEGIAARAGLSTRVITYLVHGDQRRVRAVTQKALLSVRPEPSATVSVSPCGSRRRVEALLTLGYSLSVIAEMVAVNRKLMTELMTEQRQIKVSTAARIRDVYDRLWNTPAPAVEYHERRIATRTRKYAAARGYLPPMAWDDDEIDDPKARPRSRGYTDRAEYSRPTDEVVVERLMAGADIPRTLREQREAIARLAAQGVPTAEIADRLGMGLSSAIRTRNRITAAERRTA